MRLSTSSSSSRTNTPPGGGDDPGPGRNLFKHCYLPGSTFVIAELKNGRVPGRPVVGCCGFAVFAP